MDDYTAARAIAISYIGISQKTSGRVRDKLLSKEVKRDIAEEVVSVLIQDGYIDDLRVAKSIIRQRVDGTAESIKKLTMRLLSVGISRESAYEAVEFMVPDEETIEQLIAARILPDLKRQMDSENLDAQKWMEKTARFLMGRGYSRELIISALHDTLDEVK